MNDRRFIVIEGPLGSGKTTLAKVLGSRLNAKLVLEEPNPFLESFFKQMDQHAFQLQTFSLLSRFAQQKEILQVDLFQRAVLSDYLFVSEHIFGELHLNDEEFVLYDKLIRTLDVQAPIPDLVIYLQTQPEILHDRLHKSEITYGRAIELDYLKALVSAYNNYFFYFKLCPLLVVNTEKVNFFANDSYVDALVEEMPRITSGVHHFVPAA